jgi:hypothetical protein
MELHSYTAFAPPMSFLFPCKGVAFMQIRRLMGSLA